MEFDWIEAIGYAGTGLTIVAYGMKDLLPLRVAAILSSVFFLLYGLLTQSYPLVLMELVLLPLNVFRLIELLANRRRTVSSKAVSLRPERIMAAASVIPMKVGIIQGHTHRPLPMASALCPGFPPSRE